MSSNPQRLAEKVLARRTELDRSQLDVWQAGGPSNTTQTRVENALINTLSRTTARKLDRGLEWEDGSARRVWDGGDPVPKRPVKLGDLRDMRAEILAMENIKESTRAHIIANIEAEIAKQDRGEEGVS